MLEFRLCFWNTNIPIQGAQFFTTSKNVTVLLWHARFITYRNKKIFNYLSARLWENFFTLKNWKKKQIRIIQHLGLSTMLQQLVEKVHHSPWKIDVYPAVLTKNGSHRKVMCKKRCWILPSAEKKSWKLFNWKMTNFHFGYDEYLIM